MAASPAGCRPYTAPELRSRKRLAPAARAISSVRRVPSTALSSVGSGFAAMVAASTMIAVWITASNASRPSHCAATSAAVQVRISPRTKVTSGSAARCGASRATSHSGGTAAKIRSSAPASVFACTALSTSHDPTKPVVPVMSTLAPRIALRSDSALASTSERSRREICRIWSGCARTLEAIAGSAAGGRASRSAKDASRAGPSRARAAGSGRGG